MYTAISFFKILHEDTGFVLDHQQTVNTQESSSKFDFSEFDNVSEAFIHLTSNVANHLQNANFSAIRRACVEQINTPSGAPVSRDLVQAAKNLDTLLDTLAATPYWSWIDFRLLQALVTASGSVAARSLLLGYKNYILPKKLIDVLPSAPSIQIKKEYFAKIVSKLNKEAHDITVADLLEFRSQLEGVILDINRGTCVLDHFKDGCIEIHWYIPINCADHAFWTASCKCHKFHELDLQYIQIGNHPPIFDPLALDIAKTESDLSEHSQPDIAGKVI